MNFSSSFYTDYLISYKFKLCYFEGITLDFEEVILGLDVIIILGLIKLTMFVLIEVTIIGLFEFIKLVLDEVMHGSVLFLWENPLINEVFSFIYGLD